MERRDFLKSAGAGLTAALAGAPAVLGAQSPNDTLGVACIGVGTRGFQLLKEVQACPNTEVRIICDLYKPNVERARQACKNPNVRLVHEWEKAVSDKNVDAVVIATPDFWHATMTVAAAGNKKDVYCEKGLCRTLAEAKAVRKAIQDNQRVLQLGHHYNSMAHFQKARELYQSGILGKCPMIRMYIDRTNPYPEWKFYAQYDINELPAEATRENIDWNRFLAHAENKDRPFDPERFFRWRNWWEYGTGIAGDLMSHLWDSVNLVTGLGIPESVMTQGDLYFWKGDRDVPDQWHVLYDYPKKETAMSFECVFHNKHRGELAQYLGREKTLEVSPRFLRVYDGEWKPSWKEVGAAARKRAQVVPELGLSPDELGAPESVYPASNDWWGGGHMRNFIDCVRSRQTPNCGMQRAYEEAVTIALSVEAYRQERKVRWDSVKEEIV
ncbi:MAG TPA: Gfo/Idh/MocA family oxidoreductase [Bryobacteraceae bacterium]|nr:Gfo/Idh/MocA family oxidoreductase [Bryobacteraceae bacterium]